MQAICHSTSPNACIPSPTAFMASSVAARSGGGGSDMVASADKDAEKRDAVLRRMLATPRPGKGEKKGGEGKPVQPKPQTKRGDAPKAGS
jgi:hypothetical protein